MRASWGQAAGVKWAQQQGWWLGCDKIRALGWQGPLPQPGLMRTALEMCAIFVLVLTMSGAEFFSDFVHEGSTTSGCPSADLAWTMESEAKGDSAKSRQPLSTSLCSLASPGPERQLSKGKSCMRAGAGAGLGAA